MARLSIARHMLIVALSLGSSVIASAPAMGAEHVIALAIVRGALPASQRVLRIAQGDVLRLRATSDEHGELHLHAYRLAAKVEPGTIAELVVHARASGRFRLEWHATRGDSGKTGQDHHGPALATLEVRPPQ